MHSIEYVTSMNVILKRKFINSHNIYTYNIISHKLLNWMTLTNAQFERNNNQVCAPRQTLFCLKML